MQVGVHSLGPLSILQGTDLVLAAWLSCGWVSILLDHSLSCEALTPLHSVHGWSIGRVALAFVCVWDADNAVNWTLSERLHTYLMALSSLSG